MEEKYIKAFEAAKEKYNLPECVTVTIHNASLKGLNNTVDDSVQFDAIVSPANSYAKMDGGFDDALSRTFSPHNDYHALTRHAQAALYEEYRGFQPPGSCLLIPLEGVQGLRETNEWGCKYLLHSPTMRSPQNVTWDREVVYECIWTILCAIDKHNRRITTSSSENKAGEKPIESFLMTPLATGCGFWSPERWAAQTVVAIRHFVESVENAEKWRALKWGELFEITEEREKTYKM